MITSWLSVKSFEVRLEALKGSPNLKGVRVDVKMTKLVISSDILERLQKKGILFFLPFTEREPRSLEISTGVKKLRVNIKETKMIISSHNSGKVTEERKFIFVVCREGVGSNSIFCQFCWCWVHKIFVDIRGKLK